MHGLLNTLTNWNIKMLNGWALHLNDEEERCAQGTCPDSGRKDYCRSLNQNRSLEVIKGNKRKRHIFITMTKKTANCISNFKMRICNYFEYHWCIPEKVKGMCIIIMQTYLCSSLTPVLLFFFFPIYPWVSHSRFPADTCGIETHAISECQSMFWEVFSFVPCNGSVK